MNAGLILTHCKCEPGRTQHQVALNQKTNIV